MALKQWTLTYIYNRLMAKGKAMKAIVARGVWVGDVERFCKDFYASLTGFECSMTIEPESGEPTRKKDLEKVRFTITVFSHIDFLTVTIADVVFGLSDHDGVLAKLGWDTRFKLEEVKKNNSLKRRKGS